MLMGAGLSRFRQDLGMILSFMAKPHVHECRFSIK